MPEVEDASILSPTLELLHVNFRELRQQIEHEMSFVRSQASSGNVALDVVLDRVSKLRAQLRAAKRTHLDLTAILRARARFYNQFGTYAGQATLAEPNSAFSIEKGPALEVDLPVVTQIASYLAERGCYSVALDRLLAIRPEIRPLVDTDIVLEETNLISAFEAGDLNTVVKWCRTHRSTLKRRGSKLELYLHLRKFSDLASQGEEAAAVSFAQKAFSRSNPVDFAMITETSAVLWGGAESSTEVKSSADIIAEIRSAVREVYRRPKQNPLVNGVLLGAAALKTKRCSPGSQARLVDYGQANMACPLCRSIKLQALFDSVPYAQHTRSHLDSDLKMFPSGAIFSLATITDCMSKHFPELWKRSQLLDPVRKDVISLDQLVSVYAL